MGKAILIGVDGLSYDQWFRLMDMGAMPVCKELVREGNVSRMNSSIPEVSSVAWTSMVTGKNPGEHNVFGFTDLIDGSYTLAFTSSRTLKAKSFWQWNTGKKHLIVNVPQTYPAQELSGILISGYVALDLKRAVSPVEKLQFFEEQGYTIDVDMSLVKESKELFFQELEEVLDTRWATATILMEENSWDSVMFVITGSDRLSHYMWDQWEDPNAPYHTKYVDFFTKVDNIIGSIVEKMNRDDIVVIVSDHGFERQTYSLNLNTMLKESGFLSVEKGERITYGSITPESKAFCMDPGRIYIHREDRFPNGKVREDDVEKITSELVQFFNEYRYKGNSIVKEIYKGDEVFYGPYAFRSPELVLLSSPGISFSGRIQSEELTEETIITGKHRYDDAVFVYKGAQDVDIPTPMDVTKVTNVIEQTGLLP